MPKVFWGALDALRWWLVATCLLGLPMACAGAPPTTGHQPSPQAHDGITLNHAAYRINRDGPVAQGDWRRAALPLFVPLFRLVEPQPPVRVLEADFHFDGPAHAEAPLALLTHDVHNRLQVLLNGREIFRDFAAPDDPVIDVHRPVLVPLPADAVQSGQNDLRIRVYSRTSLALAPVRIGPQRMLEKIFNFEYIAKVDLPRKMSFTMLVMSYAAILFWFFKKSEKIYLLFAVMTYVWAFGNSNYIISVAVFGEHNAFVFADTGLVLAQLLNFLFCAIYLGIKHWRASFVAISGAAAVFLATVRISALAVSDDAVAHLLGTMLMGCTAIMTVIVRVRTRGWDGLALALLLGLLTLGCVHDLGRMPEFHGWDGLGFDVQPFNGFVVSMAFLGSFGQKTLSALAMVEKANKELEGKVRAALSDLAISEEKRRSLEVTRAIELERERLLREMHDGIGSNLVVALKVAEQQKHPPETLTTLRQALADLRITVDSLEPIEGDIVALLGNLRHRLERDLAASGIRCRWNVGDCPPVAWLDATNALHLLRIFQEAVGNSLNHAGATVIEIGCNPEIRNGIAGICAYLHDDGTGFDPAGVSAGKGLRNMVARAKALAADFACDTGLDEGTRISLWLPLVRR